MTFQAQVEYHGLFPFHRIGAFAGSTLASTSTEKSKKLQNPENNEIRSLILPCPSNFLIP
jgi:hypothetical protein